MLVVNLCLVPPVAAQRNVAEVSHPAGVMTLRAEDATTFSWVPSGGATTFWQRPGGRFQLLTGSRSPIGGDPTRTSDEDRAIASDVQLGLAGPTSDSPTYDAFTSKLTVSVDGLFYDLHALGAAEDETTGTVTDYWPVPPQAGSRDVLGVGRIPIDTDDPNTALEYVDIQHHWTLIHDAVRIEYIVENHTGQTAAIGLRQLIDASFGQWQRDGGTIVLPSGQVIVSEKAIPDADVGSVPDYWVAYDRVDNPTVVVGGTLDSADVYDPGIANSAAGKPDEIAWGLQRGMAADAQWDFTPNAGLGIEGENWAYAVKWNEADLQAGRSRRYVTYFGMGAASVDFDPPYALAGYSPLRLEVQQGDDPATSEVEQFHLTDPDGRSPFPVYAYADNFSPSPLFDASVRISLPDGFVLDPPNQSIAKSLGTVGRNELKYVSWTVRATVARPGQTVVKFTGPNGKSVEREIVIPVIPALTPRPSLHGLEMVSIPYRFTDTSVEHVFGSLGSMHVGGSNGLARWNADEQIYRWFPHSTVSNVVPGAGYWLLNKNRQTVYFPSDIRTVPTGWEYSVSLDAGWNQIGTPFTSTTYFESIRIIDRNGSEWSMAEAVSRKLLLPTLFSYDAVANEYVWASEVADVSFEPYEGNWLFCFEDLTLLFTPASLYASTAATSAVSSAGNGGGESWKAQLVVSGAGITRAGRCFGSAVGAEQGIDASDVLAPPGALTQGVALTAEMLDARTGARLMEDIRPASSEKQTWTLAVMTNASGEAVSVRWPDLSKMPSGLVATLVDCASGERRYMRTTNSYTFRASAEGGTRLLNIEVQPRPAARTLVKSAHATQTGSAVTLVYSLSSEAAVDLEIMNISGVPIRVAAADKLSAAGVNTLVWDGRNARGARVPAGRYLLRVSARSPLNGEQSSVVCSFQLAR